MYAQRLLYQKDPKVLQAALRLAFAHKAAQQAKALRINCQALLKQ
jgi:hypothetical protein